MKKQKKKDRYQYFIDLFITDKKLFEHWNPSDIVLIAELPYPIYNDIILKQFEERKKEKKMMDEQIKEHEAKQKKMEARLKRMRSKR